MYTTAATATASRQTWPVAKPIKLGKAKKMNIFHRWIVNKAREINENSNMVEAISKPISRSSDLSDNRPMTFNIYRANGGTIVELRKYDNRKDHWDNNLHVIPDGEDFSDSLSKIVTLETLRS